MCMAHAQLVAAHPNIKIVELCQHQGPLQWGIVKERPAVVDGHLILPESPGLGVELVEDVAERFPHVEGHYAINVER